MINASGPWVDEVRSGDYARNNKQLRLTKGVHVVIDQSKFPLQQAVYFDTEKDGRMILLFLEKEKRMLVQLTHFMIMRKLHH